MSIPAPLLAQLQTRFGSIAGSRPLAGGSVNRAYRLETARKGSVFLKYNPAAPPGMFRAEASGLQALAEAAQGHLAVPRVWAVGEPAAGMPGWIALEWLESLPWTPAAEAELGRGLAALHRLPQTAWGWPESSFIGPMSQVNSPRASWGEFWRDHRLAPQLRRATDQGLVPGRGDDWQRLFKVLPQLLEPADEAPPSLLHGDFWSGNALATAHGPAVFDPAIYRGHREVDLAMAQLFGGLGEAFLAAYHEAYPLDAEYARRRRAVYQLYYLLVHVNLFGGAYVEQTARVLHDALAYSA